MNTGLCTSGGHWPVDCRYVRDGYPSQLWMGAPSSLSGCRNGKAARGEVRPQGIYAESTVPDGLNYSAGSLSLVRSISLRERFLGFQDSLYTRF